MKFEVVEIEEVIIDMDSYLGCIVEDTNHIKYMIIKDKLSYALLDLNDMHIQAVKSVSLRDLLGTYNCEIVLKEVSARFYGKPN